MKISDFLQVDRIECNSASRSKKNSLQRLSELLAGNNPELDPDEILTTLMNRERLGSTGLGHGVAIPHGRLQGGEHTLAAFLKLEQAINFDAIDDEPVDLLFGLLVPEQSTDQHLQILAQVAQMFDNQDFLRKLRDSQSEQQLFDLLTQWHVDAPTEHAQQ